MDMTSRKRSGLAGVKGDNSKQLKSFIKNYGVEFHSMPLTRHDLEVKVTIGENEEGAPEFNIQGLDITHALVVFKMLEMRIVQRIRDLKRTKGVKMNGDDRKMTPNIKIRFDIDDDLDQKYRDVIDRYLPEPVENQPGSSSGSSPESSVKRKTKKVDSVKKNPKPEVIPEPEPLPEKSPVRSPVRRTRTKTINTDRHTITEKLRVEWPNGEVEETFKEIPNPYYQNRDLFAPTRTERVNQHLWSVKPQYGGKGIVSK